MKQDDSKPVFSFFSSLMIIGIGLSNFFIRKSKVPSLFNYIFFYSSNVGFLFLRFFSVLFFFYIIYKEKSIRKFLPLLFTYVVFIVLEEFIFIHGVFIYDFGDVSNFEGMGNVIGKLVSIGTTKLNLQTNEAWIIASQIKLLISKTAFFVDFYFVIYNIVLFFIISGKTTLDVLVHGIEIQLLFMIPFGIVELLYIWGFSWANVLVENIFVKLYDIGSNTTWWPPIHWPGMRNIFGESSFLVVYCSISIPFLLYYAFHKKKIIYFIELFILLFFSFSTNGRTSFVIWGQFFVFLLASIIGNAKKYFKYAIIIFCLVICSFFLSALLLYFSPLNLVPNNYSIKKESYNYNLDNHNQLVLASESYFDYNISTLTSLDTRSNGARFSNIIACINVWKKHPLLGVSDSLSSKYMIEELDQFRSNGEVNLWITFQEKDSLLKGFYSYVSGYFKSLSEGGIVGIICDYFPVFILVLGCSIKFVFDAINRNVSVLDILCLTVLSAIFVVEFNCASIINIPFVVVIIAFISTLFVNDKKSWREECLKV